MKGKLVGPKDHPLIIKVDGGPTYQAVDGVIEDIEQDHVPLNVYGLGFIFEPAE